MKKPDDITSRREFFPAAGLSLLMLFVTGIDAEAAPLTSSQKRQLKALKRKLKATRNISDPVARAAARKKIRRQMRAIRRGSRR